MNNKKHSTLSNTLFAVSLQLKAAPVYTVFMFFNHIIGDVITLFEHTFLLAYIVECVEKGKGIKDILYFLIPVFIAVMLKISVNNIVRSYVTPKETAKIKKSIHLQLYEKAVHMDLSKYDNSEFYNDFVWAMQKAPDHITASLDTLKQLVSKLVIVIITGTFIISADFIAIVIVAIMMFSTLFFQKLINKRRMKKEEDILPASRKRNYTSRVFYLADFVKDIKISSISDKLSKDFYNSSEEMKVKTEKHGKFIGILEVLRDTPGSIIYDGVYLTYLFYKALVKNYFGLGTLLALYNSANRLSGNLRRFIILLPSFHEHSLYVDKIRTFLESKNDMEDNGTKEVPKHGDIVLKNVNFTYPSNEKPTINGISMEIKKGEKIALVGFNGAGKSTLVKLILRLYDPDEGSISFGKDNIKEYPLREYRNTYGVLFQDFEIIATDIAHNISMTNDDFDVEKGKEAIKKAAFEERLDSMPDGFNTQLTREFDDKGINLSGGEAQKIALARVLYADSSVIILDEPSSALDPIAEYQLNKAVTSLTKNKTVIIISHRLSTTRFVDKIYMLENGKIIEEGNHNSLMKINGKYANMFNLQAEKYIKY